MKDLLNTLLHRLPPHVSLPSARIDRLLVHGLRLLREIPPVDLDWRQKRATGGYLFWEGPFIVDMVAEALAQNRPLFPEIQADPTQMQEGLLRATGWLSLRALGLRLAAVADDHYARETGALVKTALDILRHVRADRVRLYQGEHEAARRRAMAGAESLLAAYRRRLQKK